MRFSAMGDAAMTVPVLHALATQHPDLRITMLTRTRFVPMFEWLPANVQVKGIDFEKQDGIIGLTKIYNKLKEGNFDAVADLHDVLRSKYIRTCFAMAGIKVAKVNKGRSEKKALIGNGQTHAALTPMTERYAEVFRSLGFPIDLTQPLKIDLKKEDFAFRCTPAENLSIGQDAASGEHTGKGGVQSATFRSWQERGRHTPDMGEHPTLNRPKRMWKNGGTEKRDAAHVAVGPDDFDGFCQYAHRLHLRHHHPLHLGSHTPQSRIFRLWTKGRQRTANRLALPTLLHLRKETLQIR